MARAALVLVDSGVTVVGSRGSLTSPSPGLALIDGDEMLVGGDARDIARLKPRKIHSHFWQSLNTDPLERPFPSSLRTADLAHAHLTDVWRAADSGSGEVILVVPGVYTAEQMALLLGIARAADIPVRGLVDLAVAAAADRGIRRRCFHLDLHLHRFVVTEVEQRGDIFRGRVWENDAVGLAALQDLWARTVARAFVRQIRFDPLHLAATEQELYLQLPRVMEALTGLESARVTVAVEGTEHGADVERHEMVRVTADATRTLRTWLQHLTGPEDATLLVSDLASSVPGLVDHLRENLDSEVEILHPATPGSTALGHAERIITNGDALPLVTSLPGYDARPPGPVTVPVMPPPDIRSESPGPTHLVIDGVAQRITGDPVTLFVSGASDSEAIGGMPKPAVMIRRIEAGVVVEAPPGIAVVINGRPAESPSVLSTGDRLCFGKPPREVLLVTMEP